MLLHLFTWAKS